MLLARQFLSHGCVAAPMLVLAALMSRMPAQARDRSPQMPAFLSRGMDAPLPPRRPSDLTPVPKASEHKVSEHEPAAPQTAQPETAAADPACTRALASPKLIVASIAPVVGTDGCGIEAPLKLTAIVLADGTHVPLEPAATIRCTLAEALGDWVRDDIAPLAEKTGSGLSKLVGSEGYECRPRNHVEGAKLSEHGKGNAYDLLGFVLRNGQHLTIDHQTDAREFMAQLKSASCARFMTVLGPGSDGYHESHLHVDLAERHSDYRICQWDLK
jgi:hypothetical protein